MYKPESKPSPNYDDRKGKAPRLLIVHYTGMMTAEAALARLCDPAAKVSAHYLVTDAGDVVSLVPEEKRAWHAGVAFWHGETDINAVSIGIELVNPGHEFGYKDFSEPQIAMLEELAHDIVQRHGIAPAGVVGHSDVAWARKQDPGEKFPWRRLAESGLGVWPSRPRAAMPKGLTPDLAHLVERLEAIGYMGCAAEPKAAAPLITAFQRHFLPDAIGTVEEGRPSPRTLMQASAVAGLARKGHGKY